MTDMRPRNIAKDGDLRNKRNPDRPDRARRRTFEAGFKRRVVEEAATAVDRSSTGLPRASHQAFGLESSVAIRRLTTLAPGVCMPRRTKDAAERPDSERNLWTNRLAMNVAES